MKYIDMRMRPPTPQFRQQHHDLESYVNSRYAYGMKSHPVWLNQSLEQCVKDMEKYNYVGVAIARSIPATTVPNDHVRELADKYPNRFIPVGGVDGSPKNLRPALAELDRIAKVLKLRGVAMDTGFLDPPMLADDPRLYPIYERCSELGLFVGLQIGPLCGPTLAFSKAEQVEKVLRDFPKLQLLLMHGAFPFIDEVFCLMLRYSNLWWSPDSWGIRYKTDDIRWIMTGAACQDRCLFGSALPYGAGIIETIQWYDKNWSSVPEEVKEKYFYKNALRLFGLKEV